MMTEVSSGTGTSFDAAGGSVTEDDDTGRENAGAEGACGVSVLTRFPTGRGVRWRIYEGAVLGHAEDSLELNARFDGSGNIHRYGVNVRVQLL
jgi:hypothetical protein